MLEELAINTRIYIYVLSSYSIFTAFALTFLLFALELYIT